MNDNVEILRRYNRWRRGQALWSATADLPDPRVVGEAIDAACDEIERLRAENEALRRYANHTNDCNLSSIYQFVALRGCNCGFDALAPSSAIELDTALDRERLGLDGARPPTPTGWSDTDWIKHLQEQEGQHPLEGLHINQGSMDAAADAYEAEYNEAQEARRAEKLRKLGARLAELLDEDQFAECEALLLAAGVMPEANEGLRAELAKCRRVVAAARAVVSNPMWQGGICDEECELEAAVNALAEKENAKP